MRKVEEFYSDNENEHSSKEVATVMGLQPESDIWVLNDNVHINEDGQLIPRHSSPYIWLAGYTLEGGGIPTRDMESSASARDLEGSSSDSLANLTIALEEVHQHNLAPTLYLLGAQILCCQYESIFSKAGQVPATIAFGSISLGKSTGAEAAQSLLGLPKLYRPAKITDAQGVKLASNTTMGYVIEDPSDVADVAEKILTYFEKGSVVTRAGTYEPRCTFLMTMNLECLNTLAQLPKR